MTSYSLSPQFSHQRSAMTSQPLVPDYSITTNSGTGQQSDLMNTGTTDYEAYPRDKVFINSSYTRDPLKTTDAKPTSDRDAVMTALRGLQKKIRRLELERSEAENKLRTLATDTVRYREELKQQQGSTQTSLNLSKDDDRQSQVLRDQLDSSENRCQLLQKQLDYMRKMVQNAEHDRTEALKRTTLLDHKREDFESLERRSQLDKLSHLEREHLKLTATQTLAENKIRELEEKLKEERHYRKLMQGKAAELETAAETNRILLQSGNIQRPRKVKKKKKVTVPKKSCHFPTKKGREPPEHYKLNIGDIPFVAGKATTPSHSVPANFQEVLSLMKSHNNQLCSPGGRHFLTTGQVADNCLYSHGSSSSSGVSSQGSELDDLLLQLQEEFGHLTYEHHELSRQIQEAVDPSLREDLEREQDRLLTKMEIKGDQIARLRKHRGTMKKPKAKRSILRTPPATKATIPAASSGEVEVTTTVKAKGKGVRFHPGSAQASLRLLKDLKQIQTTLRKDEVSWE